MNVLDIEALSVSFLNYVRGTERTNTKVIQGLNLSIGRGEIVAVVGASGSGKSLLAHAIMGILPRNAARTGEIRMNGRLLDEKELLKARGRTLALLPQSVGYLNPLLSVGRQLQGPFDSKKSMEARQGLLARLGLGEKINRLFPFQLSGGMARKLLLAMSAQPETGLIIADEPTPGMGSEDVAETLHYFRELAAGGTGILMITHDLEAAAGTANRVVVMREGEVVEIAQAGSFAGDGSLLQHPYSRELWQALPGNGFKRPVAREVETIGQS
jgi:peptide/nickel transport system ATP-binding protein